jgi:hypothetical protein
MRALSALHQRVRLRFVLTLAVSSLLLLWTVQSVYAASGIWGSYVVVNSTFYVANDPTCVGCPPFNGHNFGTVSDITGLTLNGGEVKTFKNSGSDVTGAAMLYRVYPTGSPSGSFLSVSLPFNQNMGTCNSTTCDQRWQRTDANIDLLQGLNTAGSYTIEVYFEAYSTDGTHYHSNNGSNYTAQFTYEIPQAVTLALFEAEAAGNEVVVRWETASELNNVGFNVYRGLSAQAEPTRLNGALIPSQAPGSGSGFSYGYHDSDVQPGVTYYYWLEDVDSSGVATRHGPVTATAQSPTVVTMQRLAAEAGSTPPWGWALLTGAAIALGLIWWRRW